MTLLDALNWRYATKKMNGQTVEEEKVQQIIDAAHLAPTSSGLQPFKIFVVKDLAVKAAIQPIAFGQTQIVDASHLLIFASWDQYTPERIESVFAHINKERGLPVDANADYKNSLIQNYSQAPLDMQAASAGKQAYIAFGMAIAQAALLKVDATPMEGFNNAELDALLKLNEQGLKSQTILALGYRDAENDWLVNLKKVRKPKSEFVQYI